MIKKSYKLIEFGNKQHSVFKLTIIASIATLAVFSSTFSIANAKLTFRQLFHNKNIKSSLRRVAWYIRRSWLGINLIDDVNFDITEDLTPDEIQSVNHFLMSRKNHLSPELYYADQLYILANRIHRNAQNASFDHKAIDTFKHHADAILSYCFNHPTSPLSTQEPRKQQNNHKAEGSFVQLATDILQLFAKHMPIEHYPWYVISGTFLGLHRENGFLPHDIDLDFGINATDIDQDTFIEALNNIPEMTIKNITNIPEIFIDGGQIGYRERLGIIKLLHTSGIQIDFFIHHHIQNKLIHGSKIHIWENTPFGLTTRLLAGVDVLCPDNPDLYLTENYGDWRTPVTEFNCSTDTTNMSIAPNFYSVAFFIRKLYTHLQKGEASAYTKALHTLHLHQVIVNQKIQIPFLNTYD